MSKVCEITVNVDEALSVNKYEVDEETPHPEAESRYFLR